jgi:hypothetical protein
VAKHNEDQRDRNTEVQRERDEEEEEEELEHETRKLGKKGERPAFGKPGEKPAFGKRDEQTWREGGRWTGGESWSLLDVDPVDMEVQEQALMMA